MEELHYFDYPLEQEPPRDQMTIKEKRAYDFRRAVFRWWDSLEDNWKRLLLYTSHLQDEDYPHQVDNSQLRNKPIEPEKKSDLLKVLEIKYLNADYLGGEIYFDKFISLDFLPNLQSIAFEGQGFKDFSAMRRLCSLQEFIVIQDNIQSLDFLLPNIYKTLERLFFWRVNWDSQLDFKELSDLTHLTELTLLENNVADISFITSLKRLTEIDISTNSRLVDIGPLSALKNLNNVELAYNRISDISPLTNLKKLRWLDLDQNHIEDISPLAELKLLSNLTLSNNPIKDFTPLQKLTSLNTLWINNTPISEKQLTELQKALPACDIHADHGDSYIYNWPEKREW